MRFRSALLGRFLEGSGVGWSSASESSSSSFMVFLLRLVEGREAWARARAPKDIEERSGFGAGVSCSDCVEG